MAKDIATARKGAKVLGLGAVDVRDAQSLQDAADRCVKELGSIDFCMYADKRDSSYPLKTDTRIVPEQQATSSHQFADSLQTPSNPSSTSM
jgi:hypothetical protein